MSTEIPALVNPHAVMAEGNKETPRVFVLLEFLPENRTWLVKQGTGGLSDGIYEIDKNFKVLVEAVHKNEDIPEELLQVFSYDSSNNTLTPMDAEELNKIQSL